MTEAATRRRHSRPQGIDETETHRLLVEFASLDERLLTELDAFRAQMGQEVDGLRGLCISESEVDAILQQGPRVRADSHRAAETTERVSEAVHHLRSADGRAGPAAADSRLQKLSELFAIDEFDRQALLICLAPELDRKYEKVYAYLQDDVTKKRPLVDLVLRLSGGTLDDVARGLSHFSPSAPLIKHDLIQLEKREASDQGSFLSQPLQIDRRVTAFLLGGDEIDDRIQPFADLTEPVVRLDELALPEVLRREIEHLIKWHEKNGRPGVLCKLTGAPGSQAREIAEAWCNALGSALVVVDLERLIAGSLPFDFACRLAVREAILQSSALLLEHSHRLLTDDEEAGHRRTALLETLRDFAGLAFLEGEEAWPPTIGESGARVFSIRIPEPAHDLRKQLWEVALDRTPTAPGVDLDELAAKFRFTPGLIDQAARAAENLALQRASPSAKVSAEDLNRACRFHSNRKLGSLAQRIVSPYSWDSIILPRDKVQQLREICHYVKHRHTVFSDWGFERKLSLLKGLNALFAGPSGTGKTMAAGILANELELDLYKIDLSLVVSKYIGETEKNLSKIFKEAETSNAILFFDEADALFGKRSEVKDSHDRYANIEINYLLQKMEEHQGIVILASNFRQNIDEAFARRMHFTVEFPFPDEEHRERIWVSHFPKEAPRSEEIDFTFLARRYKLAGGSIRNIVLGAAFLAAENGQVIGMGELIKATKREFQKLGKLCVQADFEPYYDLIRE